MKEKKEMRLSLSLPRDREGERGEGGGLCGEKKGKRGRYKLRKTGRSRRAKKNL